MKTREIGAGQIDTHFQNSREIVDFKLEKRLNFHKIYAEKKIDQGPFIIPASIMIEMPRNVMINRIICNYCFLSLYFAESRSLCQPCCHSGKSGDYAGY